MKLTSPAFQPGGSIPRRYSQHGENLSPPLDIADLPPKTISIVLIADDPDAPRGTFTPWIAFNLSPRDTHFAEGRVPGTARLGLNSKGSVVYIGPRPPDREHRYFFRAFALSAVLNLPQGADRFEIERGMKGQILDQAELMGRFAPLGQESRQPSRDPVAIREEAQHETVARRAYELWEQEGRPENRAYEHWVEAERQVQGTKTEWAGTR